MGIIIKPLVTEKMTAITDKLNRFGFVVRPDANKLEIKKEVEALYNVTVVDVNTVKYAGKNKSRYTKAGIINGRNIIKGFNFTLNFQFISFRTYNKAETIQLISYCSHFLCHQRFNNNSHYLSLLFRLRYCQ